jgi:hypothetical protein
MTAVEDHWRRALGEDVDCRYVTHQAQAVASLRDVGRDVVHLPAAIEAISLDDPIEAIERIEDRYGDALLPLARYLMSERYFRGRNRSWQLDQLARHAVYFDRMFETFAPDLLVGESADIMPTWLAYDMAPVHGCEPVGLIPSTLPPARLLMLRGHDEIAGAEPTYREIQKAGVGPDDEDAARALQAVIRGEGTKLDYLPPRRDRFDFIRRLARGDVLRDHLSGSVWQLRERRAGNWFVQPDPFGHRLAQIMHHVRGAYADRRYLTDVASGRPYVFYPLHYEPEATTLIHGSYFEDQLTVVKNLARSLPAGWELVVKEHFYMRGQRRLSFYRELRSVPNLRLLPFAVPTNELIINAQVVSVISSTAGLEAALIGKPVLMFGDYPWDYAPTVHRAEAPASLPAQIKSLAAEPLGPDHPDVLAFGASWDRSLPAARYFKTRAYDWTEPDNVRRIAEALLTRLPKTVSERAPEPEAARA